jgi:hypothetical protein
MKKVIISYTLLLSIYCMTSCGGSIESQNDKHIRKLERALQRGDIKGAGKEMKYLDDYDDNGGRFTREQDAKFEELSRKYPESIRRAHHEKDRLQGK